MQNFMIVNDGSCFKIRSDDYVRSIITIKSLISRTIKGKNIKRNNSVRSHIENQRESVPQLTQGQISEQVLLELQVQKNEN